jgi:hypothetical protein
MHDEFRADLQKLVDAVHANAREIWKESAECGDDAGFAQCNGMHSVADLVHQLLLGEPLEQVMMRIPR